MPPVVNIRDLNKSFYNILPDNGRMMYDITEHVISKTQRGDIGFVTGRMDNSDAVERLECFRKAMNAHNLKASGDMIFNGNYWLNQGPETADFFIRDDGTLPEAIICSNDYMALALADELILRGYEITKDVMITGFDNIYASAAHIPSLTTADIPENTLAHEAVLLLEKIIKGGVTEKNHYVNGRLILRESTDDSSEERDLFKSFKQLEIIRHTNAIDVREFAPLIADFEDALSFNQCVECTMNMLKGLNHYECAYLCCYRENTRELIGMYDSSGIRHMNIEFPISDLFANGNAPSVSVVSIDMDGLKNINDNYGHTSGDVAIKALAKYVESALAESEFVARMGGDEFEQCH